MIAAEGLASRPTRSRSAITRAWLIFSNRQASRQAANQRRKVLRQLAPRAAAAHDVENAIDDLAERPGARSPGLLGRRQRRDHAPFLVGHIALVAQTVTAIVLAGGWEPHGNSDSVSATARNHVDFNHSTPFETASQTRSPDTSGRACSSGARASSVVTKPTRVTTAKDRHVGVTLTSPR